MSDTWLEAGERECSAIIWGDRVTGHEAGGMVVFGSAGEVRQAVDEGPFRDDGFVELAAPAVIGLMRVVRVTTVAVKPDAVLRVEPLDLEELLDGEGEWRAD